MTDFCETKANIKLMFACLLFGLSTPANYHIMLFSEFLESTS